MEGHHYEMEAGDERVKMRSGGAAENNPLQCKYEGCGQVCKSRAELAIHMKRMLMDSREKVEFTCDKCH